MPRVKEFDETRALEAAMHVFWDRGYKGTSLPYLEKAMGLTRTSIYNAYGNKRQLFEKTIDLYQKNVYGGLLEEIQLATSIKEGLRNLLLAVINLHFSEQTPGGCMIALSLLEKTQHNKSTSKLLDQTIEFVTKSIELHIKQAQEIGEISKDKDTQAIASMVVTTMAGMMVQAKAGVEKKRLVKIADTLVKMLEN
ncbi:hypothetical protein MNBD_GAMMA12-276 [hydrothermal vent metagenome]|uniref:HTH tetR-type domain-containing protein n=1 Tax=hydrothermal vent metagenome TaxID=652676 RepID=A0A3B0YHV8_9ZZZZ